MDPNESLRQARELANAIKCVLPNGGGTPEGTCQKHYHCEELAELFLSLDNWLSSGGFPPNDWRRARWQR